MRGGVAADGGDASLWRSPVEMSLYVAVSAFALASLPAPALAQMHMPGMTMPMPAKKAAAKKPTAEKAAPKKSTAKKSTAKKTTNQKKPPAKRGAAPHAQKMPEGMTMPLEHGSMPMPPATGGQAPPPMDHSQMHHGQMGQMSMPMSEHAGHEMAMTGAL